MGNWRTYLIMYFSGGRKLITDIVRDVEKLGFKASIGTADFIYEWAVKPTKGEVLKLADEVNKVLAGSGAMFNIDTHD